MEFFTSYDGTTLAYRVFGAPAADRSPQRPPLVCLPGGPGRAAEYLGDLGGLSDHRTLVVPDSRGTGASALPADLGTCRVDRLVEDVEALRRQLRLDRIDLLGHSAGGGTALLYAAAYPAHLNSLTLVTPSFAAVGLPSDTAAEEVLAGRAGEPWYPRAVTAYRAMKAARSFAEAAPHRLAFEPLMYGRWDAVAQAHAAADPAQRSLPASEAHYAGYAPTEAEFTALHARLAGLDIPVHILAGAHDLWPTAASAAHAAELLGARLTVLPGSGHYPWLDAPTAFIEAIEAFPVPERGVCARVRAGGSGRERQWSRGGQALMPTEET
ncbi:alpha/beta fold hydrolase [Streptomyces sp. NPDC059534]|uniref:alpha/beta fold hydrolase n=1 Tax=Streptomyces sp. NPDC059534 TaxID=3346859 RepID=UPI0036AC9585